MRLIRLTDVSQATGLRRSTIYKYIAEGAFPKAVPLGGGRVAWVEQEIQDWIIARIGARDVA
ncbi:AlpA family transcriptional regulator [Burkholderia sp. F1]|uniref:AlpA family transcriptional regulator n=1 Tax=Burkholderia sp. F1 TaxID=3366817 RepID=UPI003D76381A